MSRELRFRAWDGKAVIYKHIVAGFEFCNTLQVGAKGHTVMQFTGVRDKNGNLIYEGDRLKFTAVHNCGCCKDSATGEVQYDTSDASFYIFSDDEKYPHVKFWNAEDIEVIGNIWEGGGGCR